MTRIVVVDPIGAVQVAHGQALTRLSRGGAAHASSRSPTSSEQRDAPLQREEGRAGCSSPGSRPGHIRSRRAGPGG
jgi:hypothetical protein